tara:strand:+ start:687 stop:1103 length:417 start_codon:yes stop_codon:yes gene_type:complete
MSEEDMFEQEETRNALGYGYPEQEEKQSLIAFFNAIIRKATNFKTGNLSEEELGFAKIPVRTSLEIANYCNNMGMQSFADVFLEDAQILASTSLSKEGFLPKLAVTTQKFSETSLKKTLGNKQKKGLFGNKKVEEQPY